MSEGDGPKTFREEDVPSSSSVINCLKGEGCETHMTATENYPKISSEGAGERPHTKVQQN